MREFARFERLFILYNLGKAENMDNFKLESLCMKQGLYNSKFEHDNCGIGAVVNIKGEQSRIVVENALQIVERLEHRAGKDSEGKTGDGVGILVQMPYEFFRTVDRLGTKVSDHL